MKEECKILLLIHEIWTVKIKCDALKNKNLGLAKIKNNVKAKILSSSILFVSCNLLNNMSEANLMPIAPIMVPYILCIWIH